MNLTQVRQIVTWPETHYTFIEKIGPFQDTALKRGTACISLFPRFQNTTRSLET